MEEGVDEGVAAVPLLADFGGEVVGSVLGLPDAVLEGELVYQCAVGAEGLLAGALKWNSSTRCQS